MSEDEERVVDLINECGKRGDEIERLTADRDEWERLWKKASIGVFALQARVEALEGMPIYKRIAEQDEQIASLQDKVHLCTAYDRMELALNTIVERAPANGEDVSYLIAKRALAATEQGESE